jgi:hypothetical protein
MIINSDLIISWKVWKPFMRLFRHGIGISRDGGYVQGFIKVLFPRVRHWSKGKGTLEKGFVNEILERMPSSVNLRRIESPRGKSLKGRRIMGRWSRQMGFKKSSSRVKGEHLSSGVIRKSRGKGFGMVACESFVRARKRIQNHAQQQRLNVIIPIVG